MNVQSDILNNRGKLSPRLLLVCLAALLSGCSISDTISTFRFSSAYSAVHPLIDILSATRVLSPLLLLADFSLLWLPIAILIYTGVAYDRSGTYTIRGRHFYGEPIKGDPNAARTLAIYWLTSYPFAYIYFHLVWIDATSHGANLTGFPNLDGTLVLIVFPIIILIMVGVVMHVVLKCSNWLCSNIIRLWRVVIRFSALNLVAWLFILVLGWLVKD
uniref:Uncharacterized protein n=1 Tax=Candidatus Kentrum sp. LFY TaxID=2126342 RepID=A0A450WYF7_9GAMM|nr:MAG: hypothetical protein BECKLFY1418C_GA0070996_11107 [Candidatus Kentron sp. LFY]